MQPVISIDESAPAQEVTDHPAARIAARSAMYQALMASCAAAAEVVQLNWAIEDHPELGVNGFWERRQAARNREDSTWADFINAKRAYVHGLAERRAAETETGAGA